MFGNTKKTTNTTNTTDTKKTKETSDIYKGLFAELTEKNGKDDYQFLPYIWKRPSGGSSGHCASAQRPDNPNSNPNDIESPIR